MRRDEQSLEVSLGNKIPIAPFWPIPERLREHHIYRVIHVPVLLRYVTFRYNRSKTLGFTQLSDLRFVCSLRLKIELSYSSQIGTKKIFSQ